MSTTHMAFGLADEENSPVASGQWLANPGRWCGECNAHGWHHTDRHADFVRSVAGAKAQGDVVGVADCTNYLEVEDKPCTGTLTFRAGELRAACDSCGAWCGRLVAKYRLTASTAGPGSGALRGVDALFNADLHATAPSYAPRERWIVDSPAVGHPGTHFDSQVRQMRKAAR